MEDLKSQRSVRSRASRASIVKINDKKTLDIDKESLITVSLKKKDDSESDVEEEDEWTAI